jgi:hypothetical protein
MTDQHVGRTTVPEDADGTEDGQGRQTQREDDPEG